MANEIILNIDGNEHQIKYDNMEVDHVSIIDLEKLGRSLILELEIDGKVDRNSLDDAINSFLDTIYDDIKYFAVEYADDNEIELI
ncbi:hypothetical protein mru_0022 [Methanobrevibacter ruminantium M1]|uniref:Uncharacterized protein n=1 Tax=Methanobrevibacter ruminantium (strain ATCC 35063 / DSM 1093 / JCM 13430 / OCM 146 / M1) TaxID=634498 RepID=D3E4H8_METRM|nr:hypothetical protein [Methanobrevibacter ruminantium]ADC45874.1 hypothetical protein mru_0022 [Methanobrevibacter ruminantium M1]